MLAIPRKEAIETLLRALDYTHLITIHHVGASEGATMRTEQEPKPDRPYHHIHWEKERIGIQLKVCGDAKIIVDWLNGVSAIKVTEHHMHITKARYTLAKLWSDHGVNPVPMYGDWLTHQYREHNKLADKLATIAVVHREAKWIQRPLPPTVHAIWGSFDGGKRSMGSGMGW